MVRVLSNVPTVMLKTTMVYARNAHKIVRLARIQRNHAQAVERTFMRMSYLTKYLIHAVLNALQALC